MFDATMTPHERILASALSAVPGMIAIPLLMRLWAPTWAVLVWLGGNCAFTFGAWYLILRTDRKVEQWWSNAIGLWFGLLPLSAVLWDRGTRSFWIAAVIVMISIASEVASLPYVRITEWRVGVVTSGAMLTLAGFFEVQYVALAIIPVLASIVSSAHRMHTTRKQLEQARITANDQTRQAEIMARHDELTGLLNRRGITEEIERVAAGPHSMVMVDADRFKSINDGYGYAAGDQVIQQIAKVLRSRLGEQWVVGRHGGDEFVAVAAGQHDVDFTVCWPVDCRVSVFGSTSTIVVGLTGGHLASPTFDRPDRILSKAGYAMRAAKRLGTPLIDFDADLANQFSQMLEVSAPSGAEMRSALTSQFQVVVDRDQNIVGCETLSRWRRADGSWVAPDDFLPVLADNGQMPMFNELMLSEGISFAARFSHLAQAPFVAVNIGAPSLTATNLVALVASLLDKHQVAADRLMIEITETDRLGRDVAWKSAASQLKGLGVKLAVDDFGSGYSNIERLSRLPISHLKFDRSLTTAIHGPLREIVKGVVKFADQTDISIIGEGIESAADLDAMQSVGVRYFQGYHLGRPADANEVEQRILDAVVPGVASRRANVASVRAHA